MLSLSPRRIAWGLMLVMLCLTLASIAGQLYCYFVMQGDCHAALVRFVDLDSEANLPTWYSSSTLLICSILLAAIAWTQKMKWQRYVLHWAILSIIFLGLSLDEAASAHEMTIEPLRSALHARGFFYFTWVIPGAACVLIFVLSYLRFLAELPPRTRWLFLAAGAIFVGGAMGVEMVSGYYADFHGQENIIYAMITTVEELLEMLGIVVFIYALLSYLGTQVNVVRFCINDHASAGQADSCRSVAHVRYGKRCAHPLFIDRERL